MVQQPGSLLDSNAASTDLSAMRASAVSANRAFESLESYSHLSALPRVDRDCSATVRRPRAAARLSVMYKLADQQATWCDQCRCRSVQQDQDTCNSKSCTATIGAWEW